MFPDKRVDSQRSSVDISHTMCLQARDDMIHVDHPGSGNGGGLRASPHPLHEACPPRNPRAESGMSARIVTRASGEEFAVGQPDATATDENLAIR